MRWLRVVGVGGMGGLYGKVDWWQGNNGRGGRISCDAASQGAGPQVRRWPCVRSILHLPELAESGRAALECSMARSRHSLIAPKGGTGGVILIKSRVKAG
jgi:hypothetical protein